MKKTALALFLAASMMAALAIPSLAIGTKEITISKVSKVPVIDGVYDPDEGWGDPVANITFEESSAYLSDSIWEGEETLIPSNVTAYFRWDSDKLYFCSVIVDDVYFNDCTLDDPANAYAGDALQFDIKSTVNDTASDRYRLFYGLNNDGELVAYQDMIETGASAEIGDEISWLESKVTRNEDTKTTTYESVFDLTKILPNGSVSEGETIYVREIVLCTEDEGTEDIVDLNVPGMNNGDYLYFLATCGPIPAAEAEAIAAEEAAAAEAAAAEEAAKAAEEAAAAEAAAKAAEEAAAAEAAAEEAAAAEAAEEVVEEEDVAEVPVEIAAPQTFDFALISAVAAIISAAGWSLTKKH